MEEEKKTELAAGRFPLIEENGTVFFGGDQEWYSREWQRWAGCASVTGANMAAYYEALLDGREARFNKADYLVRMQEMYRYMTPGIHGFPDPEKFVARFIRYEADHGLVCSGSIFHGWTDWHQAAEHVRNTLQAGHPLALLVLRHTESTFEENTWHWMTITGYNSLRDTFEISNCGEKEEYDAALIFRPYPGNEVWLASFCGFARNGQPEQHMQQLRNTPQTGGTA